MYPPAQLSPGSHSQRGRRSSPETRSLKTSKPLPAFIAYGDVAAARNSMHVLTQWLHRSAPMHALQPMFWRFDQLDQPQWREPALLDSSRAAVVAIALNDESELNSPAAAWLAALASRQRGRSITLIAILHDEAWTVSLERVMSKAARPAAVPSEHKKPAPLVAMPGRKLVERAA